MQQLCSSTRAGVSWVNNRETHEVYIYIFLQGPLMCEDQSSRHTLFFMALDQLCLEVIVRTTACVISYIATLARVYMSSDIDFHVWSVVHSNVCLFKPRDTRMLQIMVVPL